MSKNAKAWLIVANGSFKGLLTLGQLISVIAAMVLLYALPVAAIIWLVNAFPMAAVVFNEPFYQVVFWVFVIAIIAGPKYLISWKNRELEKLEAQKGCGVTYG